MPARVTGHPGAYPGAHQGAYAAVHSSHARRVSGRAASGPAASRSAASLGRAGVFAGLPLGLRVGAMALSLAGVAAVSYRLGAASVTPATVAAGAALRECGGTAGALSPTRALQVSTGAFDETPILALEEEGTATGGAADDAEAGEGIGTIEGEEIEDEWTTTDYLEDKPRVGRRFVVLGDLDASEWEDEEIVVHVNPGSRGEPDSSGAEAEAAPGDTGVPAGDGTGTASDVPSAPPLPAMSLACLERPLCVFSSLAQGSIAPDPASSPPGLGYVYGRAQSDFRAGNYVAAARGFAAAADRVPSPHDPAAAVLHDWMCQDARLALAGVHQPASGIVDDVRRSCPLRLRAPAPSSPTAPGSSSELTAASANAPPAAPLIADERPRSTNSGRSPTHL